MRRIVSVEGPLVHDLGMSDGMANGLGWHARVPDGWTAVSGETAEAVRRELNDGEDESSVEVVLVREGYQMDTITVMAMDVPDDWLDLAAVEETAEALREMIADQYKVAVSKLGIGPEVGGSAAAFFSYFIPHATGRLAYKQGLFGRDLMAYYLILTCGSGDMSACGQAYDEVVGAWTWAGAPLPK